MAAKIETIEQAREIAQAKADATQRDVAIRMGDGTFRVRFASGTETDYILGEVIQPRDQQQIVDAMHAERYPDGCSSPGHRCERCAKRVGDEPHRFIKVGARRGYKGRMTCAVPTCPYYMS